MSIRFTVRDKHRRTFLFLFISLVSITLYLKYTTKYARKNRFKQSEHVKTSRNNEDRLNTREQKPVLLLYWSSVFGASVKINNTEKVPYFSVNEDCDEQCELTVDKTRAHESDAIIIHARDPNPFPPPEKFANIPLVLHTHENPVYTDILQNSLFTSHFKYLISYRLDSHFPFPLFSKPSLALPVPFKDKHKMVLAAFSNCEPVRTVYIAKLMQFIHIDSYGACLNNKKDLPKRYQNRFKEKKTELSRYYKFTLVFMNADCDYFVDDQLTHALAAGSVPVFMGTDHVDEFLPGNLRSAIIKVKDFKSPGDLAKYLKFLSSNESEYNKYLAWKYQGFQFPPSYYSSPIGQFWESRDTVYCKLCKRLTQPNKGPQETLKADMCRERNMTAWLSGNLRQWFPTPDQVNRVITSRAGLQS